MIISYYDMIVYVVGSLYLRDLYLRNLGVRNLVLRDLDLHN